MLHNFFFTHVHGVESGYIGRLHLSVCMYFSTIKQKALKLGTPKFGVRDDPEAPMSGFGCFVQKIQGWLL